MVISAPSPWTVERIPARLPAPCPGGLAQPSTGPRRPGSPLPLQDLVDLGRAQPGMTLDDENDWRLDGCFVGAEGKTYASTTPWQQVPPMLPNNGKPVWRSVILVNGIMTDVALQASDMQRLANTGCQVVGIHNATRGMTLDLAQCVGDKLDLELAGNQATATAEKVVADCLGREQPPLLVGHSQGALVVSNALGRVQARLVEQGLDPEAASQKLQSLEVTTLGGASWTFPGGPKYRHFVNHFDVVPMGAGVGAVSWLTTGPEDEVIRFSELNAPTHLPNPGDGVSNYLARVVDRSVHGPQDVYIPHWEQNDRKG